MKERVEKGRIEGNIKLNGRKKCGRTEQKKEREERRGKGDNQGDIS